MSRAQSEAKASAESGFSLVEVLAALALIGVALLPIYELNVRALQLAARLEQAEKEAQAWRTALTVLDAINPAINCSGSQTLGTLEIEWRCTAAADTTPNALPPTAAQMAAFLQDGMSIERASAPVAGPFAVTPYWVDIEMVLEGRRVSRRVLKFGWRRTLPYALPF